LAIAWIAALRGGGEFFHAACETQARVRSDLVHDMIERGERQHTARGVDVRRIKLLKFSGTGIGERGRLWCELIRDFPTRGWAKPSGRCSAVWIAIWPASAFTSLAPWSWTRSKLFRFMVRDFLGCEVRENGLRRWVFCLNGPLKSP